MNIRKIQYEMTHPYTNKNIIKNSLTKLENKLRKYIKDKYNGTSIRMLFTTMSNIKDIDIFIYNDMISVTFQFIDCIEKNNTSYTFVEKHDGYLYNIPKEERDFYAIYD